MKDQDLLSIKEFSELTGIKQSKLRYYDEVKLFRPVKRGENGYRYYSAPQTIAANLINVIHSLRIPVKKIDALKRKRTPEQILELLRDHELDLNQELFRLQQAYAVLHMYSQMIQEGLNADEKVICQKKMPALPMELGPLNDFSSGYLYNSFFSFLKQMNERNIDPAYPAGGFYENMDAFAGSPGQPARFFLCAPAGRDKRKEGDHLVGYTRGYYGNLGTLPADMQSYAKENGLTFTGPVYEMYLFNEFSIDDPDQYLIQVSVPVKKWR